MPAVSAAVQRAWQSALESAHAEVRSRTSDHVPPSREWFALLPLINQWLLGSGSALVCLGLFCLIGIPLLAYAGGAASAAVFPYTGEGKRETCLSHLQQINQALSQYRSHYDDKLPGLEYTSEKYTDKKHTNGISKDGASRRTWVAVLSPYSADSSHFTCPTSNRGQGDGVVTSSYGFNPILANRAPGPGVQADKTMLIADRADLHDTLLLPPFVSWPAAPLPAEEQARKEFNPYNLAFRHDGKSGARQAAVLYADGHADSQGSSASIQEAEVWGGAAVFEASLKRLETQHPLLKQIPSAKPPAFKNQKKKLLAALSTAHALQRQSVAAKVKSEPLEKRLWKGAGTLRALGDASFEKQLTADLNVYSHRLAGEVEGQWNQEQWKPLETEAGEGVPFVIEFPRTWSVENQVDGRYRTIYFRSPSPHIEVLVERGERNRPVYADVIDWTGMEASLKKRYGKGYKRIMMGRTYLSGQEVSLWECELKKPDGPRLRKRYIGHTADWNSTILVCSAPAGSFKAWEGVFQKFQDSFEFAD